MEKERLKCVEARGIFEYSKYNVLCSQKEGWLVSLSQLERGKMGFLDAATLFH